MNQEEKVRVAFEGVGTILGWTQIRLMVDEMAEETKQKNYLFVYQYAENKDLVRFIERCDEYGYVVLVTLLKEDGTYTVKCQIMKKESK